MAWQLAFNNEPLDLTDHKSVAVQFYTKAMAQFGNFDKKENPLLSYPIYLEFTNLYRQDADPHNKNKPETYCQFMTVPASVSVNTKFDGQLLYGKWTVYENMNINSGGHNEFSPRNVKVDFKRTFYDSPETNPLLFFFVFLAPQCEILRDEAGEAFLKYQNTAQSSKKFMIRNVDAEERNASKLKRLVAKVNKMIWDEEDGLSPVKLMEIASVHGIPNALDERYLSKTRLALDKFISKTNIADMENFMSQINAETDTEIQSLIKQAIEFGILAVEKKGINEYWQLVVDDGSKKNMGIVKKGIPEEKCLLNHIQKSLENLQVLKDTVYNKNMELQEK